VQAKAPLPEEAIFNRNQAAAERRRAANKAHHKEREIAKRGRNGNRIKRRKVGECNVLSNEDPSPEPTWSGDEPSVAVDWSDMSRSSTPSPPLTVEVTSSRRPVPTAHEKNVGLSSRSGARPAREDQRATRSRTAPSSSGASEARRDLPRRSEERAPPSRHLFNGSDCPDTDSLQKRPSRARSTSSASTPSAPREADSSAAPQRLQSLIIQGGRASDVQVSLAAGEGQGPTSAMAEVGRIAPEQPGSAVPPSSRREEAGQPLSRLAASVQPPSRARQIVR
jgi:hypothetical protein